MELTSRKWLQLYSGRCNPALAKEVSGHLGVELGEANLIDFANGEIGCRFDSSVRGADVFILQSHGRPVNDAIMEQLIMIDAAKRASAKRITAVCPCYGYARQDRKTEGREPITAKLLADLLAAAGAGRIISVDLHAGQIQGFFDGPVDHLTAMPVFVDYLRAEAGDGLVVVAPDAGRVKVAERFAQHLKADLAIVHKRHRAGVPGVVEARAVVGEVRGRTCVVVDDMIDTAGTLCAAAEILEAHGAARVLAVATHPVLSGRAVERLEASPISTVVVTDTLPLPDGQASGKLRVLSVSAILAQAIRAVFEDSSVSEIFGGENQP
jgi:ribose-phosphate pyrophosphokinase